MPPRTLAFFDMDGTLVDGDCGVLFVRYCIARRLLALSEIKAWGEWLVGVARRGLNEPEVADAKRLLLRPRLRMGERRSDELYDRFFCKVIQPRIRIDTARELKLADREGPVFIITANLRSMAVRLGAELGVPEGRCIGAEPVRDASGAPNGEIQRPIPLGEERARVVRELAAREGVPLEEVRAYGDSLQDLPMLRLVGKPCAVHPRRRLRAIARREQIRVLG